MSNYSQITAFGPKDSLPTGNTAKRVRGTELDPEFAAIATAIATKLDAASLATEVGQQNIVVATNSPTASTIGFRGLPPNTQSGNYTCVLTDVGKCIVHSSGAGAGDTYTIPSNASVPIPLFTGIAFMNLATDAVTIAISSDTMYLAGTTSTGSRTLAQNGLAFALKVDNTTWIIQGTGLT